MKKWPAWVYVLIALFLIVNPVLTYFSLSMAVGMKLLWSFGALVFDLAIVASIWDGDDSDVYDSVAGLEKSFVFLTWICAGFVNAIYVAGYLTILFGFSASSLLPMIIGYYFVHLIVILVLPVACEFINSQR